MASNTSAPKAVYQGAPGAGDLWGEGEWNPTEESIRPVRGKHRVAKQRGGLARSSTVLGVGVFAAVGAGGIATAQEKPAVQISMPDVPGMTAFADSLPDAKSLPGVGALLSDDAAEASADAGDADTAGAVVDATPLSAVTSEQGAGSGETLRTRILQQAEQQQDQADAAEQAKAEAAAAKQAADAAAEQRRDAEAKEAAERKKAKEEAERKAEEERLAQLARSYTLPVASYTITSTFGQAGAMWSSGAHTGLDFAAPTGTPIKAIHAGTVTQAGWSGSYGYHTVIALDDGTELTFSHQSSIGVSVGQKVGTGDVIGRVGATGNVTGPHLHLEVHTDGGVDVDPLSWLRGKGLSI